MDIKMLFITEEATILEAMKRMDETSKKVLFVVKDGKLVAAISDGDVRRAILAGKQLSEKIEDIANYKPKYILEGEDVDPSKYMKKKSVEAVPIVDENKKILSIHFWNDVVVKRRRSKLTTPVVIMAGGKGTRLYPYTKILPKPLIPIGELPVAEIIMDRFHKFGCKEFFMIVNHKKNMIKSYFSDISKSYSIDYVDEDIPLGTGGGIGLLKGKVSETFILSNCDIIIEENFVDIYKHHVKENNMITMICSLKNFSIPYGVVEFGEGGSIKAMKEKPSMSFFTNTGCYIVEPQVIDMIGENEEIGFPDIIQRCKDHGYNVGVYPINENAWMDMGQLDELKKMQDRLSVENG